MSSFRTERMLFLHAPKTGGTFATSALRAAGVEIEVLELERSEHPEVKNGHAGLRSTRHLGDLFTVAFVRHPLAWWPSLWAHRMRSGWHDDHEIDAVVRSDDFDGFARNAAERLPNFLEGYFARYVGTPDAPVDFVGRHEHLLDDLCEALRRAGEPFDELALRAHAPVNVGRYAPAHSSLESFRLLAASERATIERFYADGGTVDVGAEAERYAAHIDLRRRISGFRRWDHAIEVQGIRTPVLDEQVTVRDAERRPYLLDPLLRATGGSLAGRRVLDLGCNAGYFSLAAIEHGAEHVLGIDGRAMHVEQAELVFEGRGIDPGRYEFRVGNVHDLDPDVLGSFDVVLCLGLLHQVDKPVTLLQLIAALNREHLVIDTTLSAVDGAAFELLWEPRSADGGEPVLRPTRRAVERLAERCGYAVQTLEPRFASWVGSPDYETGRRLGFLCTKRAPSARRPPRPPREPGWHRRRVGGLWDVLGPMQRTFLERKGLEPHHQLLDIGCGSLRGGVHLAAHLAPGHYCGIDADAELLAAGRLELEAAGLGDRRPVLVHDAQFAFGKFGRSFDFAFAQSVFTHLPLNRILRCLLALEPVLLPGRPLFATIFESPRGSKHLEPLVHPARQGDPIRTTLDADPFHYGRDAFEWLCEGTAFEVSAIEDWDHPRGQRMLTLTRTPAR